AVRVRRAETLTVHVAVTAGQTAGNHHHRHVDRRVRRHPAAAGVGGAVVAVAGDVHVVDRVHDRALAVALELVAVAVDLPRRERRARGRERHGALVVGIAGDVLALVVFRRRALADRVALHALATIVAEPGAGRGAARVVERLGRVRG